MAQPYSFNSGFQAGKDEILNKPRPVDQITPLSERIGGWLGRNVLSPVGGYAKGVTDRGALSGAVGIGLPMAAAGYLGGKLYHKIDRGSDPSGWLGLLLGLAGAGLGGHSGWSKSSGVKMSPFGGSGGSQAAEIARIMDRKGASESDIEHVLAKLSPDDAWDFKRILLSAGLAAAMAWLAHKAGGGWLSTLLAAAIGAKLPSYF